MVLENRQELFKKIEGNREGRRLITFFNFDRSSIPELPGLSTSFASDTKEVLFRVLKESNCNDNGIDLCLYTRGGDINSVWPIVSLLREFDSNFQVLIPFRAHSSGTLVCLAAKKIIMGPIAELSPIDPTTGNQFNPVDNNNKTKKFGISVEDVSSYSNFVKKYLQLEDAEGKLRKEYIPIMQNFIMKLSQDVHPLALGNVHRVHQQIKVLSKRLLMCNNKKEDHDEIIKNLTTKFYSHMHMIHREEAREILGIDNVCDTDENLTILLDELLRAYEDEFKMRHAFYAHAFMEDNLSKDVRFIGGAIESVHWSYLYETKGTLIQSSKLPANINVQVQPKQPIPLFDGFPRQYSFNINASGWVRNKKPIGVTT